jgi:hypothetical protein
MRMKRLLVLVAAFALLGGLSAVRATTAFASDSTCTIHDSDVTDYSFINDTVTGTGHFKCGGANNEDYDLMFKLQEKIGSTWGPVAGGCDAGNPSLDCETSLIGPFSGGAEVIRHPVFGTAGEADCRVFRMRTTVFFEGLSPNIQYWGASLKVLNGIDCGGT